MTTERTLVLVKPDGIQRGLAGEIITRLERTGLQIIGLKLMQISEDLASRHYGEHRDKPFYPGLVSFITSSLTSLSILELSLGLSDNPLTTFVIKLPTF